MAFDGTDPAWCAALPLTREKAWRLRIAQFGDGYQQRTLDGINALNVRFQVRFELKPADVIAAMEGFLEAQKGEAFDFRDPSTGEVYQVTCDQWQVDWLEIKFASGAIQSLNGTLSAEFARWNGVFI